MKYTPAQKSRIRSLREGGFTYAEIQKQLQIVIPKASLTYICKDIVLGKAAQARIKGIVKSNSQIALEKAVIANKRALQLKVESFRNENSHLSHVIKDRNVQKVALAMLYLGEGAKWQKSRAPKLASTSPQIICLYIDLLRSCYGIGTENLRARIQCRADQDQHALIDYWSKLTKIPTNKFYPCYTDKRTIGHRTLKTDYNGVCTIMSAGTYVQLELEQISSIIGEAMRGISAVG